MYEQLVLKRFLQLQQSESFHNIISDTQLLNLVFLDLTL